MPSLSLVTRQYEDKISRVVLCSSTVQSTYLDTAYYLADKPVNYSTIGLTQPIAYATFSLLSWRCIHKILKKQRQGGSHFVADLRVHKEWQS